MAKLRIFIAVLYGNMVDFVMSLEYPRRYQERNTALSNLRIEREILTFTRRAQATVILMSGTFATTNAINVTESILKLEKLTGNPEFGYRLSGGIGIGIQVIGTLWFLRQGAKTRRKIEEVDGMIGSITKRL